METMVKKNLSFWHNKKVFITGHTGFKGSWFSLMLLFLGAKIAGYSLPPQKKDIIFKYSKLKNKCLNYFGDIRDKEKLGLCIQKFNPDFLFHFAAQPIVLESYNNPEETFDVNVLGTLNILGIIRKYKIKNSIIVTTDKVYENKNKNIFFKESSPLKGTDPYSSSKVMVENLVENYNQNFFIKKKLKVITVRAGNVIGGGDRNNFRLIPDIIKGFLQKKKVHIRFPYAIRPWQFVLEPLYGYLEVARHCSLRKMNKNLYNWNFSHSTKKTYSVKKIILYLNKSFKIKTLFSKIGNKNKEKQFLNLNSHKAKQYLNWSCNYSIEETLDEIINWENLFQQNKSNCYKICLNQIKTYLSKI